MPVSHKNRLTSHTAQKKIIYDAYDTPLALVLGDLFLLNTCFNKAHGI